jgi:hypothetical protein
VGANAPGASTPATYTRLLGAPCAAVQVIFGVKLVQTTLL